MSILGTTVVVFYLLVVTGRCSVMIRVTFCWSLVLKLSWSWNGSVFLWRKTEKYTYYKVYLGNSLFYAINWFLNTMRTQLEFDRTCQSCFICILPGLPLLNSCLTANWKVISSPSVTFPISNTSL